LILNVCFKKKLLAFVEIEFCENYLL